MCDVLRFSCIYHYIITSKTVSIPWHYKHLNSNLKFKNKGHKNNNYYDCMYCVQLYMYIHTKILA